MHVKPVSSFILLDRFIELFRSWVGEDASINVVVIIKFIVFLRGCQTWFRFELLTWNEALIIATEFPPGVMARSRPFIRSGITSWLNRVRDCRTSGWRSHGACIRDETTGDNRRNLIYQDRFQNAERHEVYRYSHCLNKQRIQLQARSYSKTLVTRMLGSAIDMVVPKVVLPKVVDPEEWIQNVWATSAIDNRKQCHTRRMCDSKPNGCGLMDLGRNGILLIVSAVLSQSIYPDI